MIKLGRWCHPKSDMYKSCDQMLKMTLANYDSCFKTIPQTEKKKEEPETRNPISVLLTDSYGF